MRSNENLGNDIKKVLISEEEIKTRVKEMGAEISRDFAGKNLLLVGILKGSVVFMADLMRNITIPCAIEFMAVSSYGAGTATSGVVRIVKDLSIPIDNYDVLVIEDNNYRPVSWDEDKEKIQKALALVDYRKVQTDSKSVSLATMLDKPERRKRAVSLDYKGFVVPDEFVVGYGLDYDEKYRNLPYIGVLKPEVYSE